MTGEKITPYKNSSHDKKKQVARMFNNIALRYDFLNHFLSFGIDRYWRRKTISILKGRKISTLLDVATGTADLAIEAATLKPKKIYGIDISSEMLQIGRQKISRKKLDDIIQLIEGDSEDLIFEDNKFDAVTVAFGVRNFENLENGLSEMLRVLKPGGIAVILEFSLPPNRLIRAVYDFYSSRIGPFIGRVISKDRDAYVYLHDSVRAFPHGNDFCFRMADAGYSDIRYKTLTFGIVTLYTGIKRIA